MPSRFFRALMKTIFGFAARFVIFKCNALIKKIFFHFPLAAALIATQYYFHNR